MMRKILACRAPLNKQSEAHKTVSWSDLLPILQWRLWGYVGI